MKYPALNYNEVIAALRRMGFVVVRQKGSHIRLHKTAIDRVVKITVPAHKPIHPTTLRLILHQADLSLDQFLEHL